MASPEQRRANILQGEHDSGVQILWAVADVCCWWLLSPIFILFPVSLWTLVLLLFSLNQQAIISRHVPDKEITLSLSIPISDERTGV